MIFWKRSVFGAKQHWDNLRENKRIMKIRLYILPFAGIRVNQIACYSHTGASKPFVQHVWMFLSAQQKQPLQFVYLKPGSQYASGRSCNLQTWSGFPWFSSVQEQFLNWCADSMLHCTLPHPKPKRSQKHRALLHNVSYVQRAVHSAAYIVAIMWATCRQLFTPQLTLLP